MMCGLRLRTFELFEQVVQLLAGLFDGFHRGIHFRAGGFQLDGLLLEFFLLFGGGTATACEDERHASANDPNS